MTDCKDAYLFICDNLDENLESPRCRQIRRHLDSCPACRSFLQSVKRTVSLFRTEPTPHVPAATHRVLMKAITALRPPGGEPARTPLPRKGARRA